jgi:hypothetical protein
MNHYIDTNNKTWGFDETQTHLIPAGAVLIAPSYPFDTYPYLTLVNGVVTYNQTQHDADKAAAVAAEAAATTAKASALAKLAALGLTESEIKAIVGS